MKNKDGLARYTAGMKKLIDAAEPDIIPEDTIDEYLDADVPAEEPAAVAVSTVKEGDTIQVRITMDDTTVRTDVITLDANGYPVKVVSEGKEIPLTWEGL